MDQSIVFLTYISRSGSTYLASKLNEYADIGVGIEADFVDGWITPGYHIQTYQQLYYYVRQLYKESKFCQWNIPRGKLIQRLKSLPFPLPFGKVLFECMKLYFGDEFFPVMIHKGGHYYRCIESIRKELPQTKFIFIDRDPRAIYSSQRKSIDSRTLKPMLSDVHHFLFGYKDTQKIIQTNKGCNFLHVVRYENLLKNEEDELKKITQFLGVCEKKKTTKDAYFDSVPESQKHLHTNVARNKPQMNRIDSWKKELPLDDILLIEIVLKDYLLSFGYPLSKHVIASLKVKIRFFVNLMKYNYEASKRKLFDIPHKY